MKQELSTIVNDLNLLEKVETFNGLLDTQPPAKWIKDHPFARGVKYIPIQVHEKLLRVIFKEYRIEIKEIKLRIEQLTNDYNEKIKDLKTI